MSERHFTELSRFGEGYLAMHCDYGTTVGLGLRRLIDGRLHRLSVTMTPEEARTLAGELLDLAKKAER